MKKMMWVVIAGLASGAAAQEAAPSPAPKARFFWKDGKTTFETDLASMSLSNRIQFRYTREAPDDETTLGNGAPVSGSPQAWEMGKGRDSFRIRRAKMKLEGWFWRKTLTYEFQVNVADANVFEDAQLTWDVSGRKTLQVKVGQYKVPFGRQELTTSTSQQFVDRSIVSNEFNKGRDVGVSIQGLLFREALDYRLGVFNGNGRGKAANDNRKLQYNGRVVYQPWGDHRYSESDFESKGKPLLAVGAQFEVNDQRGSTTGVDSKRLLWGPEVAFKYRGLSLFADLYRRELTVEAVEGSPASAFDSNGWQVQAGCFVYKRTWEIALRYAAWDPGRRASDERREVGGAVSVYENRHALKAQLDLRQLEDEARATKDRELRVQAQFVF
jgi:hypothetical protein